MRHYVNKERTRQADLQKKAEKYQLMIQKSSSGKSLKDVDPKSNKNVDLPKSPPSIFITDELDGKGNGKKVVNKIQF